MRTCLVVVITAAWLVLAGCGWGFHAGRDSAESIRRVPILAAAMDCDLKALETHADEWTRRDQQGPDALLVATVHGCRDGVKLLLAKGARVLPRTSGGSSAVLAAVWRKDAELVRLLLAAGPDPRTPGAYAPDLITIAAAGGDVDLLRFLLQKGFSLGQYHRGRRTPLHDGARHADMVAFLLATGIPANAQDERGMTPLMHVSPFLWGPTDARQTSPSIASIRLLVEAGADVNARSHEGWTPLLFAAQSENLEGVRMLLALGADPRLPTQSGLTAAQWLRRQRQSQGWQEWLFWLLSSEQRARHQRLREIEDLLSN